jgi:hypothetical protein
MTALIVVWVDIAVLLVVLARVWLRRRTHRRAGAGTEERSFEIPQRSFRLARPRGARSPAARPIRPHDAVTAYVATLEQLAAADPASARASQETPRAHARRIAAGRDLAALQADYALARYAGRTITPAENHRAIGRWLRIREALRGFRPSA